MVTGLVQSCRHTWTRATFKRELAVIKLAFLGVVTIAYMARILVFTPDAATITAIGNAFSPIYTILVTAIGGFAGLAFGMDAWAKQIQGPKP